ncbi:MAG: cytochrome b N-terminal domain-containing protein, partial [Thermodesulfobacteriota bacterium]
MRILKSAMSWLEDRTGLISLMGSIMRHPVPPGSAWFYVFGSATLLAFFVQVATGIALAFMYV